MKRKNVTKIEDALSQTQSIYESSIESAERYYTKSYHSSESSFGSKGEHKSSTFHKKPVISSNKNFINYTISKKCKKGKSSRNDWKSAKRSLAEVGMPRSRFASPMNPLFTSKNVNFSSFQTKSVSPMRLGQYKKKSPGMSSLLSSRVPLEDIARSRVKNTVSSIYSSKESLPKEPMTEMKIRDKSKISRIIRRNLKAPGGLTAAVSRLSPVHPDIVREDNENNMKLRILSKNRIKNKIKESDIPLDLLFNQELNQYKFEEARALQKPKPIIFRIFEVTKGKGKGITGRVRFEIEGGGKPIDSNFVRK